MDDLLVMAGGSPLQQTVADTLVFRGLVSLSAVAAAERHRSVSKYA